MWKLILILKECVQWMPYKHLPVVLLGGQPLSENGFGF